MKNIWMLVMVGMLMFGTGAHATSLFPTGTNSMFADQKARNVGDLVTVIIVEQAQARQTAGTSSGKESSVSAGPGLGVLADLIPLFGVGGSDNFSAQGSTTRGGSLQAQLTTRVVENLGNNTLKIEGRQRIVVNGEEQEIIVSGIVRGRDINPDNTVLSPLVADAEISFVGTGVVGDKQKPGILTRVFNWLF